MAIIVARAGGVGIIHRFMTIEQQVEEVLKVKRSESIVIDQPYSLRGSQKLKDAKLLMSQYGITGLLVVDQFGKLEGIVTSRDILFERDQEKAVSDLMTRIKDMITAPAEINLKEAETNPAQAQTREASISRQGREASRPDNLKRYAEPRTASRRIEG